MSGVGCDFYYEIRRRRHLWTLLRLRMRARAKMHTSVPSLQVPDIMCFCERKRRTKMETVVGMGFYPTTLTWECPMKCEIRNIDRVRNMVV